MESKLSGLLVDIAHRPALYVGSCSLKAVAHLLCGYCLAFEELGAVSPMDGWMRWVELRFGISHPAWHWTRILVHTYGSESEAIAALPALFSEFFRERAAIGVEEILARHDRELSFPAPASTRTQDPSPDLGNFY